MFLLLFKVCCCAKFTTFGSLSNWTDPNELGNKYIIGLNMLINSYIALPCLICMKIS